MMRASQLKGGEVSPDFKKQLAGYGLTTAEILYRRPDHQWLLQTYVWQNYDLFPEFPTLKGFLDFWQKKLDGPLMGAIFGRGEFPPARFFIPGGCRPA